MKNKKKIMIILICFVCSFLVSLGVMYYFFTPKIYVEKDEYTIEFQSEFLNPDYEAKNYVKDYTNEVSVSGDVDVNKIGTYAISYELKYGMSNIKKIIKVNVVDTVAPTIELKGKVDTLVCPNKEYSDEGYTAFDNYDGDLIENVSIIKETDKIIYSVVDSSNNKTEVIRNISYGDEEKPNISLKGSSLVYVKLNTKYNDSGYTASDNCDGDITDKVVVSGSVDTSKSGKYTLTYSVSDEVGNSSSVSRTVWVYKNTVANTSGGEKGVIYLTFDDGPNNTITKAILDILKDEDVKATFFVTSTGSDSIIKREYDEGHTVGIHTSSHNYSKIYSSVTNYFNDLDVIKNRIKKITGVDPIIMRFPGGSSNTVSRKYDGGSKIMTVLTSEVLNRGYHYFDWNVDAEDAGGCTNKTCVYNNVTKNLSKKRANVVLMHDIKSYTKDALRDIIAYGKVNGYTFKAITEDTAMVVHSVNN